MGISKIVACVILSFTVGLAQASTIRFLDSPDTSWTRDVLAGRVDGIPGIAESDRFPVLRIWFENDHGTRHSSLFFDIAGTGTLPSAPFMSRAWDRMLPDIHYTIIGTVRRSALPQGTSTPVPLPAAILLFGSGCLGLLALRRVRRDA